MFREARLEDTALLYRWRLEAEREGSDGGWWQGTPTTLLTHTRWLERNLGVVTLLIWDENGEPSGTVRVESNGELSFHVPKPLRKQVTRRMLLSAKRLSDDHGGRLKATVDASNYEAWMALLDAGFVEFPVKFLCYRP